MHRDDVEIPEPCHAEWNAMRPEDRGRFCFECRQKVHDLSTMTQPEARSFLDDNASNDICVSYQHGDDGTIVFRGPAPAPVVPLSRLRRPRTAAAMAGAGLAAALAACAPHGDGPAIRDVDPVAFEAPHAVIPLGEAPQASTIVPPSPPVATDMPCDPAEPQAAVEPDTSRVRGRMQRTAGKPVLRKMGKPKMDVDL